MTTYYVGKGGNDSNTGLSWAQRFLTLNGAEDEPVASGDIVYVGPGIYREVLTIDVDGTSEIKFIADVTGENTDGVGGAVIISGSDADTTATRSNCIIASSEDYRTFIGFHFVGTSSSIVYIVTSNNWKFIDCSFSAGDSTAVTGINLDDSYTNILIDRCVFYGNDQGVYINADTDQAASSLVISNCLILGGRYGIRIQDVDSVVVENCTIVLCYRDIDVESLATSQTITVRNCVLQGYWCFDATVSGEITSSYCQVTSTTNTNWTAGTGDVEAYVLNLELPLLVGDKTGIIFPQVLPGTLNPYAYARRVTGSSETTTDLLGITKPTTSSKSSWGAIQYQGKERETTTVHLSSAASIKFDDAGEAQFWVPVDGTQITVSIYVNREANYAGTNPRLVIKQPGQADRTTTDAAAASQWNELTDTFTPSSDVDYIVICVQSLNTATSGSYAVYFDTLTVT